MITDDNLKYDVYQPGTLVYYLEPSRLEENKVDKIPGEVSRLNYDGTYNVELEDKRYLKSLPVNKLKKVEDDLKISDGREAAGKPKTKVRQVTNDQLSDAGYGFLSIAYARFILSTKMTGGGAYFRDLDQGVEDFGRGVNKVFSTMFGWIPNPFGKQFVKNSKIEVVRLGYGGWVAGVIIDIVDEQEKTYKIKYSIPNTRRTTVITCREEYIRWPKDDSKMLGCVPKPSFELPKCDTPDWVPTCGEEEQHITWQVNDDCEVLSPGNMNGWIECTIVKIKIAKSPKNLHLYNVTYIDDAGKTQTQKGVYASELRKRKGFWGFLPWV